MTDLPEGWRRATEEELEALAREPDPYCTAGPYIGGGFCIGYRSIPLTVDEAKALFGEPPVA